jgi:asparagine synthase (glutamine-hydrolysing)
MCGIAGFVISHEGHPLAAHAAVLERMCHVITHRGPDDQGAMLTEDGAALGMRRLAIIDVAGGGQPLSGCDDAISIVFNGEIYNFQELKLELERCGHRFHTHSDTETIVHAYEEYGDDCVEHLRGMFAFTIWDARQRRLFIARDRVGKKPLYYTLTARGTLVFGSELKALLEHPEVARELNPEALDAYLTFGYVPDPLSIFRGIYKLPPGHYLKFDAQGCITLTQYWDFRYEPTAEVLDEREYVAELRRLLDEAVKVRLISEVPLGAFLSGGVDSSTVVGLMARHTSRPVKTFSIGFHEDSYDELKYARIAAKHFGTDHHEFVVTPDICSVVDELVWHFDEPFADPSAIPTYMVSKLAREYVTVALSGDGGDELFAGYTRYVTDRRRRLFGRLPRRLRRGLMQPFSSRLPHGARGRNFIHNVALDPMERYMDSVSTFTSLSRKALYTKAFRGQLPEGDLTAAIFCGYAERVTTKDPLDLMLYLDSKTYLPGDILTKVDRMSMAVSLEARAPLLDHKLIEFVTRIPPSLKLRGLDTKYILKEAVRDLVPAEILSRPKQGFGLPLQEWINSELREYIRDVLTGTRSRQRGYFNPDYINILFDEHSTRRRDHSNQLWTLFMFELWQRTFVDRSPTSNLVHEETNLVSNIAS